LIEPKLETILEGLLFASGNDGLTIRQLKQILQLDAKTIQAALVHLTEQYSESDRGLMIMHTEDVYFLATKPALAAYCEKLFETPQQTKLSQASLETLAIIAYKQPITKTEIEEIRGVKSDRPLHTLLSRHLIEEVGRKETIGRPIVFGTSKDFLISFGLTSIDELPPIQLEETKEQTEADLFFKTLSSE